MIQDLVINHAQDQAMTEMVPYIIVGTIAMVLFIGYNVCNRVDHVVEVRKAKKKQRNAARRQF